MAFIMNLSIILLSGLVWLGLALFLGLQRKKDFAYLTFFTLFFAYFFKVLDYTLFQFQSLLILRRFMPGLLLRGQAAGEAVNLIPLFALTSKDLETSLLNILLFIPFGFGLPFITNFRMKQVVALGALLSVSIELLQFLMGFISHIAFRVADVNDVIFNTTGAALGYALFTGFVPLYRRLFGQGTASSDPISRYIAERLQAREKS